MSALNDDRDPVLVHADAVSLINKTRRITSTFIRTHSTHSAHLRTIFTENRTILPSTPGLREALKEAVNLFQVALDEYHASYSFTRTQTENIDSTNWDVGQLAIIFDIFEHFVEHVYGKHQWPGDAAVAKAGMNLFVTLCNKEFQGPKDLNNEFSALVMAIHRWHGMCRPTTIYDRFRGLGSVQGGARDTSRTAGKAVIVSIREKPSNANRKEQKNCGVNDVSNRIGSLIVSGADKVTNPHVVVRGL